MVDSASKQIADFEKANKQGVFKNITVKEVANGLRARLADPKKLDQGSGSLCGPAALLFCYLKDKPDAFTKYVLDLYRSGEGSIGKLKVKPGSDCKSYDVPSKKIHPVDWIALASLRDSENDFFDYDTVDVEAGGITMPGDLAEWFEKAGYATVKDGSNIYFNKDKDHLKKASQKHASGHHVCLFINGQVLSKDSYADSSSFPSHWIVLDSVIDFPKETELNFHCYTWGSRRRVPKSGNMETKHFLDDYYGWVAARLVADK